MNIPMILNAALACHGIGKPGGVAQNPFGKLVNFTNTPSEYTAGKDKIDACYVGETQDEVIVAFRGTLADFKDDLIQTMTDWLNNLLAKPVEVDGLPGKLHEGFSSSVQNLWNKEFYKDIQKRTSDGKRLIVKGYSKGAALAPIAAMFLVKRLNFDPAKMQIYIFEPPRPGDADFAKAFNETFPDTVRYEYQDDIVPHVPPEKSFDKKLEDIPILGKILEKREELNAWNYKSVGKLNFVKWNSEIVHDSVKLKLERIAHLEKLVKKHDMKVMIEDHMPCGHIYNVLVEKDCPT